MKPPDEVRLALALAAELEGLAVLSPFGVQIRYPGDGPTIPPGGEREIFDLARRARAAVLGILDMQPPPA
jgi:hypothetical protein